MDGSTAQPYSLESAVEMACSLLDVRRRDLAESHAQNFATAQRELAQATATLRDIVAKMYIPLGQGDHVPSSSVHAKDCWSLWQYQRLSL
jgi:hypothetical protein